MPWARLDDRFHENRKVRRLWRQYPAAVGLHVMAITYSAGNLTDGVVDLEFVEERVPDGRTRKSLTDALVGLNLWHTHPEGWEINDYNEFNPTRKSVESRRADKAAAGKKGAAARWGNGKPMAGANGTTVAELNPSECTRPDPTRPEDLSANADSPAAAPQDEPQTDPVIDDLCRLMSSEVRSAHGIAAGSSVARVTKGWRDATRSMLNRDGYSQQQIEYAIRWVCKHHYWKQRVRSMPRLRSEMEQIVNEIREQQQGRVAQVVPIGRKPNASDLLRTIHANQDEGEASG